MNRKELVEQYEIYHQKRDTRDCEIKWHHIDMIYALNKKLKLNSVLDYGCGHGKQWTERAFHKKMKIPEYALYDIAYPDWTEMPEGKYDLVISTDVLEHIPEGELLDEALNNIFSKANKAVFLKVGTTPAIKVLANGQNAHCTLKSKEEWRSILEPLAKKHNVYMWLGFNNE